MTPERQAVADGALGWLAEGEGELLHSLGMSAPGPLLEVGAYCGKSTVWLGDAAEKTGTVLFSVDHHLGSVEMQPGRENHRPELAGQGRAHDTLTHWRTTVLAADLEQTVVGIVASSRAAAGVWSVPLGLVFIDADHSYYGCRADFDWWAHHLVPGGWLVFHDTTIPDIARVVAEAEEGGYARMREHATIVTLRAPGAP